MSNPKEKAEQLVSVYFLLVQTIAQQKQCAIIAVDEILIDYSYMQNVRNANSNQIHSQRVYWQEVKTEIEKL
jgi:hypothetical protein